MAQEYTFETYDGVELYGKTDAVVDPRAAIVIVHGLCEHQGRYDYLTMRLVAQGYSVYRFDHRGHGRSKGQRVYYSSFDQIARDVDVVVDRAIAENPDVPVYIIGHSMGGYAAATYGTLYPGKVDGFVLSGAATRGTQTLIESDAADLDYVPNALGDGVCSDPAVVEAYVNDPYVEKQISMGLMRALCAGQIWLKENAEQFSDPVLILHGGDDALVNPQDSLDFFSEISTYDKSLYVYAGLCHEIFNEYDKDVVIENAIDWLNARSSIVYEYIEEEEECEDDDEPAEAEAEAVEE